MKNICKRLFMLCAFLGVFTILPETAEAAKLSMKNTDLYLSNLYGDYMKLPPVEDRKQHENYFYWLKDTLKG